MFTLRKVCQISKMFKGQSEKSDNGEELVWEETKNPCI